MAVFRVRAILQQSLPWKCIEQSDIALKTRLVDLAYYVGLLIMTQIMTTGGCNMQPTSNQL